MTFETKKSIIIINKYIDFIDPLENEIMNFQLSEFENFNFQILLRFNSVIKATKTLLTDFQGRSFMYLPINLLLRSINCDYLTILYLLTFLSDEDESQQECLKEIKILNKDFVKFIKDFSIEERDFIKEYKTDWTEYLKIINESINNHDATYDISYKKKNENINGRRKKLTEFDKFKLIKGNTKLAEFGTQAFLAFKYYSQYQHVSENFLKMDRDKVKALNNIFFYISIENLIFGSNKILHIVYKSKYTFTKDIKSLIELNANIFKR